MRLLVVLFSAFVATAAFGVGLACAVFSAMGWGGRWNPRLDLLAHFAPFWLAGGLASVVTAAFVRPLWLKGLIGAPGAMAVLLAAGLMLPEFLRPASPRAAMNAPHQLTLLQFNTYRRNVDPEGTARWIVAQNPDVVVIEEASPAVLAAVHRLAAFHQSKGQGTLVILSKAPQASNFLPWPRGPGPVAEMARATFDAAHGGFTVVGVHYAWPTLTRLQASQAADVAGVLDGLDHRRLIVAGDFNSTPWSFARRRDDQRFGLERRTRALPTWPARNSTRHWLITVAPFLPIDHVYAGPAWRTVSVQRGPKLGSDHYPVLVKLALAE